MTRSLLVLIQSVASALLAVGLPGFAQPLAETASQLQRLAGDSEAQGLGFFAAVSLHNLMEVERARGRFQEAYAAGERALGLYGEEGFGVGEALRHSRDLGVMCRGAGAIRHDG